MVFRLTVWMDILMMGYYSTDEQLGIYRGRFCSCDDRWNSDYSTHLNIQSGYCKMVAVGGNFANSTVFFENSHAMVATGPTHFNLLFGIA